MSRILTSHVGSLPRTQEVVDHIFSKENQQQYDESKFDNCMTSNVLDTVGKQKLAGIDIVSDGETSKISYATYVKDRYTGFSGDSPRNPPEDLKLFPGFLERLLPVYSLLFFLLLASSPSYRVFLVPCLPWICYLMHTSFLLVFLRSLSMLQVPALLNCLFAPILVSQSCVLSHSTFLSRLLLHLKPPTTFSVR